MSEELTIEAAKEFMQREQKLKLEQANREIAQILEKYGVQLIAMPIITSDGRIITTVQIGFRGE